MEDAIENYWTKLPDITTQYVLLNYSKHSKTNKSGKHLKAFILLSLYYFCFNLGFCIHSYLF